MLGKLSWTSSKVMAVDLYGFTVAAQISNPCNSGTTFAESLTANEPEKDVEGDACPQPADGRWRLRMLRMLLHFTIIFRASLGCYLQSAVTTVLLVAGIAVITLCPGAACGLDLQAGTCLNLKCQIRYQVRGSKLPNLLCKLTLCCYIAAVSSTRWLQHHRIMQQPPAPGSSIPKSYSPIVALPGSCETIL